MSPRHGSRRNLRAFLISRVGDILFACTESGLLAIAHALRTFRAGDAERLFPLDCRLFRLFELLEQVADCFRRISDRGKSGLAHPASSIAVFGRIEHAHYRRQPAHRRSRWRAETPNGTETGDEISDLVAPNSP